MNESFACKKNLPLIIMQNENTISIRFVSYSLVSVLSFSSFIFRITIFVDKLEDHFEGRKSCHLSTLVICPIRNYAILLLFI